MKISVPINVKEAFNELKQHGGFIASNRVITLLNWCKLSTKNSKYAIDFCSDLITNLRENYNTLFIDDVYYVRGLIYEVMQDYESAIQDFSVSVRLFKDANGALFERGKVYYLLQEYDKALKDLNLVIKRDKSNNGDYYYYRGLTFKALGNSEKSASDLKKALRIAKGGY